MAALRCHCASSIRNFPEADFSGPSLGNNRRDGSPLRFADYRGERIMSLPRLVQRTWRFQMRRCGIVFVSLAFLSSLACSSQPSGVSRAASDDAALTRAANLSTALPRLLLVASAVPKLMNTYADWSKLEHARQGRMEFVARRLTLSASSRALGARSRSTISTPRHHLATWQ